MRGMLKGAAHITGGGITDNTPRILPKGLACADRSFILDHSSDLRTAARRSAISIRRDYRRTFNLGIGMILVVSQAQSREGAGACCASCGEPFFEIGEVVKSRGPRVVYVGEDR